MMYPTVSILILTYNRMKLSKRCIPAIVEQIGDISCEVLIWDNCSCDGTLDWLLDYKKADCRITEVFGAKINIGVEAINNLAEKAKGKYILKVDDDVGVPPNFCERLVSAYEEVNDPRLLFLGWDMDWGEKTFATRSGMKLYKGKRGQIVNLVTNERVLISYHPSRWMVNGVCRLSPRKDFLKIGGHPKGVIYGADYLISKKAEKWNYWIGYLNSAELVIHSGNTDDEKYRKMKNKELSKHGAPLDV